jgi:hypothetical protein
MLKLINGQISEILFGETKKNHLFWHMGKIRNPLFELTYWRNKKI